MEPQRPFKILSRVARAVLLIAAGAVLAGCIRETIPGGAPRVTAADPDSLVEAGYNALEDRRPADAKSYFDAALDAAPDYPPALRGEADVAIAAQDRTTALHYLERLTPLAGATVNDHVTKARVLAESGRTADAIACLERAAARYPDSAVPPSEAGMLLLEAGRTADAIGWFRRAVDIGGDDSKRAHRALGRALFEAGRYADAEEVLVVYNERFPGNFDVNMELGFVYFDSGRYGSALPRYRSAVAANPASIDARVALARTLEQLGRIDNAIRVYDDVLERRGLPRELEPVILAQANLLNQRGRYRLALDLLERAEQNFAGTPGLACARGMALAGEGRFDEAVAAFSRAAGDPRWGEFANEQIRRIRNSR